MVDDFCVVMKMEKSIPLRQEEVSVRIVRQKLLVKVEQKCTLLTTIGEQPGTRYNSIPVEL